MAVESEGSYLESPLRVFFWFNQFYSEDPRRQQQQRNDRRLWVEGFLYGLLKEFFAGFWWVLGLISAWGSGGRWFRVSGLL